MPSVADVAVLALETLIDELDGLKPRHVDRLTAWRAAWQPSVLAARAQALAALADADRLDLLESATERLATVCVQRRLPHPVRLAAYNALIALFAADLVPPPTFRSLYDAWDESTRGGRGTSAVLRGEELLLTID